MDSEYFENFVIEQFKKFDNMTYVIERNTKYVQNGRIQTEDQSKEIDGILKNILDKHNIEYQFVKNTDACEIITNQILEKLKSDV